MAQAKHASQLNRIFPRELTRANEHNRTASDTDGTRTTILLELSVAQVSGRYLHEHCSRGKLLEIAANNGGAVNCPLLVGRPDFVSCLYVLFGRTRIRLDGVPLTAPYLSLRETKACGLKEFRCSDCSDLLISVFLEVWCLP